MAGSAQRFDSKWTDIPLRDAVVQVVSNNETELRIIKQYLRDLRCGAVVVDHCVQDAIDTLAKDDIDVLLVRDRLPDGDAYKLLQGIRLGIRRMRAPSVMLVYMVDRRKAAVEVMTQAQPDVILGWPFSFTQLRERVEYTFAQSKAAQNPH